jgi:uncharacterized membrane protein YfcA
VRWRRDRHLRLIAAAFVGVAFVVGWLIGGDAQQALPGLALVVALGALLLLRHRYGRNT